MSVQSKQTLFILSFLFIFPAIALAQNSGTNILFEIIEQDVLVENNAFSQALIAQNRRDVLHSLPLTVNKDVLEQLRNRTVDTFQMEDIDGNLITVEIRRIIEHLNDDWSITGFINGDPINSFTLSYSDGKMLSSIRNISSHTFMEISYRSENDSHYLLEIDPHKTDRIACGFDHSGDLMQRRTSKEISNQNLPQSTGTVVIDVMIVYTPAAETWALSETAGGVGIQNVINQSMTLAQSAVDNSNIDLEFRLVHTAMVNYAESVDDNGENDSGADLENLTYGEIPDVHEWRDQYNADLVAMFTDVNDTGGIAWLATGGNGDANFAYSITRVQQAANTTTHAHEMGHNMGNNHSRNQKEAYADESGGIFEYSTGWRWIGNNGETYISVMAYEEPADDDDNGKDEDGDPIYGIYVDYFSNPDITFQGVPTGSYTGQYAPADNARSMREMMSTVSNYRGSSANITYTLTTSVQGSGLVSPEKGTYNEGTTVELSAIPADNWTFTSWSGDGSGSDNPLSLTMDSDKSVTAIFTERGFPSLTTTAISDITTTTAQSGGEITDDGGASVTARGVCWSTSQNPIISNSCTSNGSGSGSFTSSLANLTVDTQYYVRAYATNSVGTAYGNQREFTTKQTIDTSVIPENFTLQYGDGTITLNWDAVNSGHLTGYNIYRSTNSKVLQFYEAIDSNNTTFQDSPAETMFYAVSAVYGSHGESPLSNITSFYKSEISVGVDWKLISNSLKDDVSGDLQIVGFNQVYTRENTLLPGKGYWVRSDAPGTLSLAGAGFISGDIDLKSGWNLIGGLADTFLLSDIIDPENILSSAQVYQYSGGAYSAITGSVTPGRGYWMHANESGSIRFQIAGTKSGKIPGSRVNPSPISGLHRLEFISNGIAQDFWISDNELRSDELIQYLMPPIAPSGFLDIRSDENYSVTDQFSQNIQLTSASYPVVINFYPDGQLSSDYSYRLVGIKGRDEIHINLTGQQLEIPFEMDSITLERVSSNDLITEFKLHSNYPNPFNPATNIRYELPQQSPVRIEVFDVVGRRIALLLDTTQQSGTYTVQFDGSGIASGLYLLRFQAGRFNETRQITLIK